MAYASFFMLAASPNHLRLQSKFAESGIYSFLCNHFVVFIEI
ncbi:hypothetical protein CCACVL1_15187 [Corchorus capsularis]|uniref:Uncharacterized protein n=1 Tax=Corchorus capsularis TaxID=210143 RepID=A0A1R3I3K3_COCAP|nr:hypothetical protein CCACVL1_15187 [Corchorus capsularis]